MVNMLRSKFFMNQFVNNAFAFEEAISPCIPNKLSVMIGLAKFAYNKLDKHNNEITPLYKDAFKTAINDLLKKEEKDSVSRLLNNCSEINNYEDIADLPNYLSKINYECGLYLSKSDLHIIADSIQDQFNNVILESRYDKLYKFSQHLATININDNFTEVISKLNEILCLITKDNQIETDNKIYAASFIEPLCMHKIGNLNLTLRDLFVVPNIIGWKNKETNSLEVIKDFIKSEKNVLFIEGYGGYGKSSIVSYLAYNYVFNRASPNISFLSNKQLIIIRLRDIQDENKIKGIECKLNNMADIDDDAIFIFDGLDELCMVEKRSTGTAIARNIINSFLLKNRKIIITSRPTYINYFDLDLNKKIKFVKTELCAFGNQQRCDFVDLFYSKDQRYPKAIEYVRHLPEEKKKNGSIYGSPFLLYLILSGDIEDDEKDNSWKLMHRLFYKELSEPQYAPGFTRLYDENDKESIYQLNCDIAYEMFKTQNQKLYITHDEISEILSINSNLEDYLKRSYGLYSYMRYNNIGAIEFAHNHIRDYFLCEKILREISKWYKTSVDVYSIALNICKLLQYDYFTEETKLFIEEAICCSYKEILTEPIYNIFDWFNKSGGSLFFNFQQANSSYSDYSTKIINNAAHIFKNIHKSFSEYYITWFSSDLINTDVLSMMYNNFEFINLSSTQLSNWKPFINFDYDQKNRYLNLHDSNLNGTHLEHCNLSCAELSNSDLSNAKMENIILDNANLQKSNLTYSNLSNSKLVEANLCQADLTGVNLSDADLTGANLSEANLTSADLTGANLCGADLFNTNLNDAYFYGVNICGADLLHAKNISMANFRHIIYDNRTKFPKNFKIDSLIFKKIR